MIMRGTQASYISLYLGRVNLREYSNVSKNYECLKSNYLLKSQLSRI